MLVASAMTWLLVRISPSEPMTMPLPAARPLASVVLMFTMAGSTFAAIALRLSVPLPDDELPDPLPLPLPFPPRPPNGLVLPPLPLFGLVGVNGETGADEKLRALLLPCTASAAAAPTPADAITSMIAAKIASTF